MVADEAAPKKTYPVLIATNAAGLAIPLVKWLLTKELTAGDFMLAAIPIIAGGFATTQVTPVKSVAGKVAQAAVQTAIAIDATAAGPPGTLTDVGQRIAATVTAKVAGTPPSLAESIVARTKARVGL